MAYIRNVISKTENRRSLILRLTQALAFLCGSVIQDLPAFELVTHAMMTDVAFRNSTLAAQKTIDNLGLNWNYVFQESYTRNCDNAAEAASKEFVYLDGPRRSKPHCRWITNWDFENGAQRIPGTIVGWTQVGAVREDDFRFSFVSDLFTFGVPEDDWQDPGPSLLLNGSADLALACAGSTVGLVNNIRMMSHFFDPAINRALSPDICVKTTGSPVKLGFKAPAWAFGWEDLDKPARPSPVFPNHFTLYDMHESFYRAVTGHTINGAGNLVPVAMNSQRARNDWWATGFRALGDVLHLLQDMGQPQHTRNDPHSGIPGLEGVMGHASLFEKYVEERALGTSSADIDKECADQSYGPLLYDVGYPIPNFPRYLDYWTTSLGSQFNVGKGFADYTNRGFFTAGTNLDSTQNVYSKPSKDLVSYREALQPTRADCPRGGTSSILYGEVGDDNAPGLTSTDVPLTVCSFFSVSCSSSIARTYTINRRVLNRMADLVVPRAVAYSTGLINHVFRGRLDIEPPPEGVYSIVDHSSANGFAKITAEVTNSTEDIPALDGGVAHQNMVLGHLVAVARFHRNSCYNPELTGEYGQLSTDVQFDLKRCRAKGNERADLGQEILVSKLVKNFSLLHSERKRVTFDFSENPIPFSATDLYLQIVYRGQFGGEEDGLVIAGKDLAEPMYSVFINSSDHVHVAGNNYTRAEFAANRDKVLEKVRADWPECVSNTMPPVLAASCFQERAFPLATMKFGAVTSPNVEIKNIPPRRFTRIAYLGDANVGSFINKIEGDNLATYWYAFKLQKAQWATTTEGAPSRETYQVKQMIDARGFKANDDLTYVLLSNKNPPPLPEGPTDPVPFRHLTDRTKKSDSDYTPFPVTITFPIPEGGSPLSVGSQNSTTGRQAGAGAGPAR